MFDVGYILLFLFALLGIVISHRVRCDKHYSNIKLFGVSLVHFGMVYFALAAISTLLLFLLPAVFLEVVVFELLGLTVFGAIFSLGALVVELKYSKPFPKLVFGLVAVSVLMPLILILDTEVPLMGILISYQDYIVILHLFGFALGLGGATYSDILLMKFMDDFKISHKEAKIITVLSQMIWVGVAIIFMSGLGLVLPDYQQYFASARFVAKMIVFVVLFINGVALHLFMLPRMKKISFSHDHHKEPNLTFLRKLAFILGAISLTSWYAAFFLAGLKNLDFSVTEIMLVYFGIISVAVIFALVTDKFMVKKARKD